jgi:hypothetical protein
MTAGTADIGELDFEFDETWYLQAYPDIAKAVRDSVVPSGLIHYMNFGRAEWRLPTNFDPKFIGAHIG